MGSLRSLALETGSGVFHARDWSTVVSKESIDELILEAKLNPNNKARLCIHPKPVDFLQVTYLAFSAPYRDRIHCHPNRNEILIPVHGQGVLSFYDDAGILTKEFELEGSRPFAIATEPGTWHAVEIQSETFVMVEIGSGPFTSKSTQYK